MKINQSLKLFFLLLLFPVLAISQEKQPSFNFSKYSLQFGIKKSGSSLRITSFQGTILSAKIHFTNHSAIRMGLSGKMFWRHSKGEKKTVNADSIVNKENDHFYRLNWSINCDYLYYLTLQKSIKFYVGLGPLLSYYSLDSKNEQSGYETSRNQALTLGFTTLTGTEWFFLKKMSLMLEYNVLFDYFKYDLTTKYLNNRLFKKHVKTHYYFMQRGSMIRFGLNIYL